MNRQSLCCCVFLGLASLAAAQPVTLTANGQATLTAYPSNLALPHWSAGALVAVENPLNQGNRMPAFGVNPVIHVFDSQGAGIRTLSLAIPNANVIWVRRAAHGADGSVAVCGDFGERYPTPPGSGNVNTNGGSYLALFAAGNSTPQIVRTDPYAPFGITVAPDGTVWTMGVEYNPANGNPAKTSDGVIRHFDAQGKQLASMLPQNSFRFRTLTSGTTNMASSAFGAAWYQGGSGLYYEITADGKVNSYPGLNLNVGQTALFEDVFSLALTDSGTAFISKLDVGPQNNNRIYTLDRTKGAWILQPLPAGGSPPTLDFMYGGSGNTIVMQTGDRAGLGLRFFSVGAQ